MNPRHLELADEFCKLVGKPDLLDYLGLGDDATQEDARAALKKRRRYLQGMQSNPKFKREAVFLIKHFGALDALIEDLEAYRDEVRRQRESAQLPILEVAIRTALKAGALSDEQESFLRETAKELGIRSSLFEQTLGRLAQEAGVRLQIEAGLDFFRVLGTHRGATTAEIHAAYTARYREIASQPDSPAMELLRTQLDRAWGVLSDPKTRAAYEQAEPTTGPPARDRVPHGQSPLSLRGPGAPTAPPVRPRSAGPTRPPPVPSHALPGATLGLDLAAPPRLEILGEPIRQVTATPGQPLLQEIHLRNTGRRPLPGRVTVDEPWLAVAPSTLDPDAAEQTLRVTIDPDRMPDTHRTGVVTIHTERGDRASIVFEVRQGRRIDPRLVWIGGGVLAFVVIALLAAMATRRAWGATSYDAPLVDAPGQEHVVRPSAP